MALDGTELSANWCAESCSTVGAGDLVLTGSELGFSRFSTAFSNGDKVWYALTDGSSREAGYGVIFGNVIARTPTSQFVGGVYSDVGLQPLDLTGNAIVAGTFNAGSHNEMWAHIFDVSNPHGVSAAQIGAVPLTPSVTTNIISSATGVVSLAIKKLVGQTQNLFRIRDENDNEIFTVNPYGRMSGYVGGMVMNITSAYTDAAAQVARFRARTGCPGTVTHVVTAETEEPAVICLGLKAAVDQSSDIMQWRDSNNATLGKILPSGGMTFGTPYSTSGGVNMLPSGYAIFAGARTAAAAATGLVRVSPPPAIQGVVIQADTGQTANLLEFRDDSGVLMTGFRADGRATRQVNSVVGEIVGAERVDNCVSISQADYDLLTPDSNTLYLITG